MNLDVEFRRGTSLRGQLEHALRAAIRSGKLLPGASLPPSRALAEQLGVSRGVVVDSYAQLVAEGYLSARQGSGTRVARLPAPWGPPEPRMVEPPGRYRYELRPGIADFHAFPRTRWQSALMQALRDLPDMRLTYCNPAGAPELRNAIAEHLARMRGVVVEPDRVLVSCGVSHGLGLVWMRCAHAEGAAWRWRTPAGAGRSSPSSSRALKRCRSESTTRGWSSRISPPPTPTRSCSHRHTSTRPDP